MEDESDHLVIFSIDEQQYALHLSAVERVLSAIDVTPLPGAPRIVLGAINIHGRVTPVLNMRRRFCLPEREMDLSDQLIIARTSTRSVALVVDSVGGLMESSLQEAVPAEKVLPGLEYVEGVVKLEDGMILIHDLDRFLSLDEGKSLDDAMEAGR